jgi:hypothetical protein
MIHHENITVNEAALRCGFGDIYYFSRIFKKIKGYPPSHVKKTNAESALGFHRNSLIRTSCLNGANEAQIILLCAFWQGYICELVVYSLNWHGLRTLPGRFSTPSGRKSAKN